MIHHWSRDDTLRTMDLYHHTPLLRLGVPEEPHSNSDLSVHLISKLRERTSQH